MNETNWSDDEVATLRTMWFNYHSDSEIGEAVHRSGNAVQSKRRDLNLLTKYHPTDRPNKPGTRSGIRTYTKAECDDIMARLDNQEPIPSIAASYEVTRRAMSNKIDRLLLRREKALEVSKLEPTMRKCLMCKKDFVSVHPKSTHRRCNDCQAIMNDNGESFLTVYDASCSII